jgi:N-methylhydantoinase B
MIMDPVFGGNGASARGDGATLMRFVDGNCQNTPVEVLEMRFALLCERYELRPEVAGAGRYRGGFGAIRDLRMLEDGMMLQTAHENNIEPLGRGLAGGSDGAPCEVIICAGSENERLAPGRVGNLGPFSAGEVISLRGGGGGGYGPPEERDPEVVAREVDDGLLSCEKAATIYKVRVIPEGEGRECRVDWDATRMLRETTADSKTSVRSPEEGFACTRI